MSHRWEGKGRFTGLSGKHELNYLLGRKGSAWKYNIKIVLKEIGLEDADWIRLAQDMEKWFVLLDRVVKFRGL
jgi:hypothetical protein